MSFLDENWEEVCPGCGGQLSDGVCHFYYTTWRCLQCGAELDSRVVMPEMKRKEIAE